MWLGTYLLFLIQPSWFVSMFVFGGLRILHLNHLIYLGWCLRHSWSSFLNCKSWCITEIPCGSNCCTICLFYPVGCSTAAHSRVKKDDMSVLSGRLAAMCFWMSPAGCQPSRFWFSQGLRHSTSLTWKQYSLHIIPVTPLHFEKNTNTYL